MNAKEVMQKSQWIKGPDFLWQAEDHWPQQDSYKNEVDHNSPDVRKVTANVTVEYKRRLQMRVRVADERP